MSLLFPKVGDVLARFEDSLADGEQDRRVMKGFRRSGRQCGFRGVTTAPTVAIAQGVLTSSIAGLVKEYHERRSSLEARSEVLKHRLDGLRGRLAEVSAIAAPPSFQSAPPSPPPPVSVPDRGRIRDLENAGRYRHDHQQRQAVLEEAGALRSAATKEAELAANMRTELEGLLEEQAKISCDLVELPVAFGQQLLQFGERANVYLAGLGEGFEHGRSRIRRPFRIRKKARERAMRRYEHRRSVPRPPSTFQVDVPTEFSVDGRSATHDQATMMIGDAHGAV